MEEEPTLYKLPSLEYFLHSEHVTLEPFSSKCGSEITWVQEVGYRVNSEKSGWKVYSFSEQCLRVGNLNRKMKTKRHHKGVIHKHQVID